MKNNLLPVVVAMLLSGCNATEYMPTGINGGTDIIKGKTIAEAQATCDAEIQRLFPLTSSESLEIKTNRIVFKEGCMRVHGFTLARQF